MHLLGYIQDFLNRYEAGIQQMVTKLENWNQNILSERSHRPIETVKSRVKKPGSIVAKLKQKGLPVTVQSMYENLYDIGGIRVICPFISDVYAAADFLSTQQDITVMQIKDYIEHPKKNGYRSLHLIVSTPVCFQEGWQSVIVEVQFRTVGMDSWASLEHQLCYKKQNRTFEAFCELKHCADVIADNDIRMQKIANQMGLFSQEPVGIPVYDEGQMIPLLIKNVQSDD